MCDLCPDHRHDHFAWAIERVRIGSDNDIKVDLGSRNSGSKSYLENKKYD
jgi:hypothetical protein